MDAFLEDSRGKRIPIKDGFVVGRVAGCDLVIADTKASRRHARIVVQGSVAEVEDLESANGTLLNGKPVQRRVLRAGDEITIGTTVLKYGEGAATARAPAAASEPEELDLSPAAAPEPEPRRQERVAPPPPAPVPAAPASGPEVLEFVDEVVDVRPREAAPKPAAPGRPAPAPVARREGVLLFQAEKNAKSRGLLGDDLAQMSFGMRALLTVVGLAVAGGIGWLVMTLVK